MANITKLKSLRGTLGQAPGQEEASSNIYSPESTTIANSLEGMVKVDGLSRRRSGRTVRFATTVTPEFDLLVRHIAERENIMIVEVLEKALKQYSTMRLEN